MFTTLDASGRGPFGPAACFDFHDGLNVIVGGNGTGKTTVFQLLRKCAAHELLPITAVEELQEQQLPDPVPVGRDSSRQKNETANNTPAPADLLSSLVFLTDGDRMRWEGGSASGLCLLATWPGIDRPRLEADLTAWVRRLFGAEGSWATRAGALQVTLAPGGGLELSVAGERVCHTVFAAGEQTLLHLALVAALRAQLDPAHHWPLVVDSPFGSLDSSFRACVATVLPELAKQVIVLLPPRELPEAGWQPDYELVYEGQPQGVTRVVAIAPGAGA